MRTSIGGRSCTAQRRGDLSKLPNSYKTTTSRASLEGPLITAGRHLVWTISPNLTSTLEYFPPPIGLKFSAAALSSLCTPPDSPGFDETLEDTRHWRSYIVLAAACTRSGDYTCFAVVPSMLPDARHEHCSRKRAVRTIPVLRRALVGEWGWPFSRTIISTLNERGSRQSRNSERLFIGSGQWCARHAVDPFYYLIQVCLRCSKQSRVLKLCR